MTAALAQSFGRPGADPELARVLVSKGALIRPGGRRVGAAARSPFIRPGTTSSVDYNHYSLLKTAEQIFGLPLLGDARQPQVSAFGPDVFSG